MPATSRPRFSSSRPSAVSTSPSVTGPRGLALAVAAAVGLGFGALAPAPATADSASGVFLAARHAETLGDLSAAARYYRRAVFFNREDQALRRSAILYSMMSGEARAAMRMARPLIEAAPETRVAVLIGLADAMRIGDFAGVATILDAAGDSATALERTLIGGWAAVGRGDLEAAEQIFAAAEEPEIVQVFARFHAGLMAAMEGDDLRALEDFEAARESSGGWSLQLALAAAAAAERAGDVARADAIYATQLERDPYNPAVAAAKARRAEGVVAPLTVATAAEGGAEAFYGLAAAIADGRRENARRGLVYARLAHHMSAERVDIQLLTADILGNLEQFDAAAEIYADVDDASPFYEDAQVGLALAHNRAERPDDALAVMTALADAKPDLKPSTYFTLGDLLNGVKDYDACAEAYQSGLDKVATIDERQWTIFFGLGICHERRGAWEAAEAAFRQSLEMNPGQPDVLNYLGYSLVELGMRFDEAKEMIEEAVEARPDSGYIVDSLGWVLYRLGDYDGAVRELEKAASLSPYESVINDHYGDALWKVGRKMEARFQWKRALSFEPESDEDRVRIERKLDVGLDVVLDEEAEEADAHGALTPAERAPNDG